MLDSIITSEITPAIFLLCSAASVLPGGAMSEAEVEASRGALTTFQLAILTRRNATWQGAVDWMEGQSPMSFSSDLELLSLVDRHMEEL